MYLLLFNFLNLVSLLIFSVRYNKMSFEHTYSNRERLNRSVIFLNWYSIPGLVVYRIRLLSPFSFCVIFLWILILN